MDKDIKSAFLVGVGMSADDEPREGVTLQFGGTLVWLEPHTAELLVEMIETVVRSLPR